MPCVPAVCSQCGAVFASPFDVRGENATFVGCRSTCPRCGGDAYIPDGIYSALTETLLAFTSGLVPRDGVERLREILVSARQSQRESGEVGKEIATEIPELSSVADVLPRTRNELHAFVAVIVALLGAHCPHPRRDPTHSRQRRDVSLLHAVHARFLILDNPRLDASRYFESASSPMRQQRQQILHIHDPVLIEIRRRIGLGPLPQQDQQI